MPTTGLAIADFLEDRGEYKEAIASYLKALHSTRDIHQAATAEHRLVRMLSALHDDEAAREVIAVPRDWKSPRALLNLAAFFAEIDDHRTAREALDQLPANIPSSLSLQAGRAYEALADQEGAQRHYKEAMHAGCGEAAYRLGKLLIGEEKAAEAERLLRRANVLGYKANKKSSEISTDEEGDKP